MGVHAAQGPAQSEETEQAGVQCAMCNAQGGGGGCPFMPRNTRAPTAIAEDELRRCTRGWLHTPHSVCEGWGGHGCMPPLALDGGRNPPSRRDATQWVRQ